MKIKSHIKEYHVIMEENLEFLKQIVDMENIQFVIDQKVYDLYQDLFIRIPQNRLILVVATEQNKVIDTALLICEQMTEIPAKRNAVLVSIGGGIIQDITGFVANILYRGIKWIYVPTTLLSGCDSCIGGKTSLNYKHYKNLLGTFFPPDEIHICVQFFHTLSKHDFMSGLGEVIKFNIMAGEQGLCAIETHISDLLDRKEDIVHRFVESSLEFKRVFIEDDEFDRNERIKLNFAHTFGHAIETLTQYAIPHGTAVAIGMIMANSISDQRELLSEEQVKRSEKVLMQVIDVDIAILNRPIEEYVKVIRKDKKQVGDSLTAVLMEQQHGKNNFVIVHNLTKQEIQYAVSYVLQLFGVHVDSFNCDCLGEDVEEDMG